MSTVNCPDLDIFGQTQSEEREHLENRA
jgi:hypothetical protein